MRRDLIHVVGEVFPGAGCAGDASLASELPLDAYLAGHARDLLGEDGQGFGHLVDGVRERRDLTLGLQLELFLQVALGDGGDDPGDASYLVGQVAGHHVHVVGEVLPGAGHPLDLGLTTQLSLGTDLAGHPADFGGEGIELVDHDVDGVLQLQDLAAHIDRDLLGQVAPGDSGCHLGNVAHLGSEVAGHVVDVVGQVLPDPAHALHLRLPTEAAFGADLSRHPGHLARECVQLVDHHVDRVLQLENLAADVNRDLPGKVAPSNRGGHLGNVAYLGGEVGSQLVHVIGQVSPGPGGTRNTGLAAQAALGPDLSRNPGDLSCEPIQLVDHPIDGVLQLEDFATDVDRDLSGQVPSSDCGGHVGDVAHLGGEVAGHVVHVVGQVLPDAPHPLHLRLTAKLALGPDLPCDPADF